MKAGLLPLALLGALGLAACAPDNVAACEAFVEHHNGLPCVAETQRIDPAVECPESLNVGPLDCSFYYDCLTENAFCNDGEPVRDDAQCIPCDPP